MLPQSFQNSAKGGPQGNFLLGSKFKFLQKPYGMMANFLLIPYLKTVSGCQLPFSRSDFLYTGHFLAKKTCHTAWWKKLFRFRFFWNLWRIDTLNLTNQHTEFRPHTLTCCREMLPQSFQNSAKGVPQGNFSLGLKFKSLSKAPDPVANFLYISYLKTVSRCRV